MARRGSLSERDITRNLNTPLTPAHLHETRHRSRMENLSGVLTNLETLAKLENLAHASPKFSSNKENQNQSKSVRSVTPRRRKVENIVDEDEEVQFNMNARELRSRNIPLFGKKKVESSLSRVEESDLSDMDSGFLDHPMDMVQMDNPDFLYESNNASTLSTRSVLSSSEHHSIRSSSEHHSVGNIYGADICTHRSYTKLSWWYKSVTFIKKHWLRLVTALAIVLAFLACLFLFYKPEPNFFKSDGSGCDCGAIFADSSNMKEQFSSLSNKLEDQNSRFTLFTKDYRPCECKELFSAQLEPMQKRLENLYQDVVLLGKKEAPKDSRIDVIFPEIKNLKESLARLENGSKLSDTKIAESFLNLKSVSEKIILLENQISTLKQEVKLADTSIKSLDAKLSKGIESQNQELITLKKNLQEEVELIKKSAVAAPKNVETDVLEKKLLKQEELSNSKLSKLESDLTAKMLAEIVKNNDIHLKKLKDDNSLMLQEIKSLKNLQNELQREQNLRLKLEQDISNLQKEIESNKDLLRKAQDSLLKQTNDFSNLKTNLTDQLSAHVKHVVEVESSKRISDFEKLEKSISQKIESNVEQDRSNLQKLTDDHSNIFSELKVLKKLDIEITHDKEKLQLLEESLKKLQQDYVIDVKNLHTESDSVLEKLKKHSDLQTQFETESFRKLENIVTNERAEFKMQVETLENQLNKKLSSEIDKDRARISSMEQELKRKVQTVAPSNSTIDMHAIGQYIETYVEEMSGNRIDYALKAFGGSVLAHSETLCVGVEGVFGWFAKPNAEPEDVIDVSVNPSHCWPMKGSKGFIVIKLSQPILMDEFVVSHISHKITPDYSTAPKNLRIYGIADASKINEYEFLTEIEYIAKSKPTQYFPVPSKSYPFEAVRVEVESNQGSSELTCIYRFQMYGIKP